MGRKLRRRDYFVLGRPGRPRRGLAVVLALLPALLLVTTVAHAGRGGNGKHNSVSTSSVALVSASLSPVQGGSPVYLTVCGYEMEPVEIHVAHPWHRHVGGRDVVDGVLRRRRSY